MEESYDIIFVNEISEINTLDWHNIYSHCAILSDSTFYSFTNKREEMDQFILFIISNIKNETTTPRLKAICLDAINNIYNLGISESSFKTYSEIFPFFLTVMQNYQTYPMWLVKKSMEAFKNFLNVNLSNYKEFLFENDELINIPDVKPENMNMTQYLGIKFSSHLYSTFNENVRIVQGIINDLYTQESSSDQNNGIDNFAMTSLGFTIFSKLIKAYISMTGQFLPIFSELLNFSFHFLLQTPNIELKISILNFISVFFSNSLYSSVINSQTNLINYLRIQDQSIGICIFLLHYDRKAFNSEKAQQYSRHHHLVPFELGSKEQVEIIKIASNLIQAIPIMKLTTYSRSLMNYLLKLMKTDISIREISIESDYNNYLENNMNSSREMMKITSKIEGINLYVSKDEIKFIECVTHIILYIISSIEDLSKNYIGQLYQIAHSLIQNQYHIYEIMKIGITIIHSIAHFLIKFGIRTNEEIIKELLELLEQNISNSEIERCIICALIECFSFGNSSRKLYLNLPSFISELGTEQQQILIQKYTEIIQTDLEINIPIDERYYYGDFEEKNIIDPNPCVPIELYMKCLEIIPIVSQSAAERFSKKEDIQREFKVINTKDKEYIREISLISLIEKFSHRICRVIFPILGREQPEKLIEYFEIFQAVLEDQNLRMISTRILIEIFLVTKNEELFELIFECLGETLQEFKNIQETRASISFDQMLELWSVINNADYIMRGLEFYFKYLEVYQNRSIEKYEIIIDKPVIGISYILLYHHWAFADEESYNNTIMKMIREGLPLQETDDNSYEPVLTLIVNLIESRYERLIPEDPKCYPLPYYLVNAIKYNRGCYKETMRRIKRGIKLYYLDMEDRGDPQEIFMNEQKELSEEIQADIWNSDYSNLPIRKTVPFFH